MCGEWPAAAAAEQAIPFFLKQSK